MAELQIPIPEVTLKGLQLQPSMELLIGIQMANLHVTQIKNKFQEYFSENIDISDVSNRDMEYQDNILCTRSLSAYAISIVA